jgi:hypothetical protein
MASLKNVKKYYPYYTVTGINSAWHPDHKWTSMTQKREMLEDDVINFVEFCIGKGYERFELVLRNNQSGLNHFVDFGAQELNCQAIEKNKIIHEADTFAPIFA